MHSAGMMPMGMGTVMGGQQYVHARSSGMVHPSMATYQVRSGRLSHSPRSPRSSRLRLSPRLLRVHLKHQAEPQGPPQSRLALPRAADSPRGEWAPRRRHTFSCRSPTHPTPPHPTPPPPSAQYAPSEMHHVGVHPEQGHGYGYAPAVAHHYTVYSPAAAVTSPPSSPAWMGPMHADSSAGTRCAHRSQRRRAYKPLPVPPSHLPVRILTPPATV
jgi:hypothetical protein